MTMYSATWTMVGSFNGVPYEAKALSIIKFRPLEQGGLLLGATTTRRRTSWSTSRVFDEAIMGVPHRTTGAPSRSDPSTALSIRRRPPLCPRSSPCSTRGPRTSASAGSFPRSRLRRVRLEIGRALVEINATNWQTPLPYVSTTPRVPRSHRRHLRLRHPGCPSSRGSSAVRPTWSPRSRSKR